MNNINISLVIPCYENFNSFKKSFSSAINQKSKPEQIIIIDSSNSDNIREYIQKNNYDNLSIEIIYHHEKIYIQVKQEILELKFLNVIGLHF